MLTSTCRRRRKSDATEKVRVAAARMVTTTNAVDIGISSVLKGHREVDAPLEWAGAPRRC
jgi:hypothetical protein